MITAIVSRNVCDSFNYRVQVVMDNGSVAKYAVKGFEVVTYGLDRNQLRLTTADGDPKYFVIDALIMA